MNKPDGILQKNYRVFVVINALSYLGFGTHTMFIPLFFWINVPTLALFNIFSAIIWAVSYFLNRNSKHRVAIILLTTEVILHALLATFFLGWASGFHYYFLPLLLFNFINYRQTLRVIIVFAFLIFLGYIGLYIYTHRSEYHIEIMYDVLNALNFMNIAVNFSALGILGYHFRVASIRAEPEMEYLAMTDALTKLFNRRKMHAILEQEAIRFEREPNPFLIAITDIDRFKKFNDNYGHICGDYVLKEISLLMDQTLRKQDSVARWGGEEFLIMLPNTKLVDGIKVVEKLRKKIADTKYRFEGNEFKVTLTFGVTEFDGSASIESCINRADEMLFAGKKRGRNCVITTQ